MKSESVDSAQPSLSAQIAVLLSRALEHNLIIRLGAVILLIWVWLTLLGFTLGVTREVVSFTTGRAIFPGLSSSIAPGVTLLVGAGALVATIPTVLVWNELLRLTRILARLVTTALYWRDAEDEEPKLHILRLQELIRDVVDTFVRWFRVFAVTWIVVLIASALGTIVVLIGFLFESF